MSLTLTATPTAPPGTYPITVSGQGDGVVKTTSFSVTVTAAPASPPLLNFSSLLHQYVNEFNLTTESLSGDGYDYYYLSYDLDGILSGAEKTEDEVLLQKALGYIDNMLSTAKDLNGDGYREWPPMDSNNRPQQLQMYQSIAPIARAAAVIVNSPTFQDKYRATAQRYIQFVDDHVIQYWYKKVYNSSKVPCPGGAVWDDKCSLVGIVLASLYRATGDSLYEELATQTGQAFQNRLEPYQTGSIWDNGIIPLGYGGNQEGVPDTSHANREAMMTVFMHEVGIVFTRADVERLANTLTDIIWDGSVESPLFANYINGSNQPYRSYTDPGRNGYIYFGWALLGKYSPRAQEALSYTLKAIIDGKQNPSLLANSSYRGLTALSGHLLRNQ
jgi:hypothetical protein